MSYYKFLTADNRGPLSDYQYPAVGEWTPRVKKIEMCSSGYHICEERDLVYWLHCRLYEVEVDGDVDRTKTLLKTRRL